MVRGAGGQPADVSSHILVRVPGLGLIRGGVPVIFPWFGPRSDGRPGPSHGFARALEWSVEETRLRDHARVEVTLALTPNETTRALGYDQFHLRFRVTFGAELQMELEIRNDTPAPMNYEEALHTYFAIGDIHQVTVSGLEGTTIIDKTDGLQRKKLGSELVRIAKETDQVHLNTQATCVVHDPVWGRRIVIEKSGSESTVVWNPWSEKAARISDLGADAWQRMLCVESANVGTSRIPLAPGESHTLRVGVSVHVTEATAPA